MFKNKMNSLYQINAEKISDQLVFGCAYPTLHFSYAQLLSRIGVFVCIKKSFETSYFPQYLWDAANLIYLSLYEGHKKLGRRP